MSKSVAERVSELEANYKELYDAARRVVENWSNKSLAQHVNNLEELLDAQDGL